MYYRLWKKLYKELIEHDPENEVIVLMEILERQEEKKDVIEELIKEIS